MAKGVGMGLGWALALAALGVGATPARGDEIPVSPAVEPADAPPAGGCPAPPPPSEAKNLDEPVAVVEGTVITRRRLMRAIGPRTETQEEAEYEGRLFRKLTERATELILLKAAERNGLKIPPEVLDNAVRQRGRDIVDQASKKVGRPVTLQEVLAQQNLTFAEFRESLGNKIVIHHYFDALWKGMPGKRAQFDLDPSPADIRRVYERHAAEFDVKPAARIAFWVARPVDYLEGGKRTYEAAVAEATQRLTVVLERVRGGRSPEDLAKDLSLAEGTWFAPPKAFTREEFLDLFQKVDFARPLEVAGDWLFDAQRKVGEGRVFEGSRGLLVGVAVLELTPGRKRSFGDPEVQEDIVKGIREVRRQRAMNQHLLILLARASVHPPVLAEQIQASVKDELKKLDSDPFARTVWLR